MRAEGSDGAELQGAKAYLRGIFAIQTATQAGLSATLNNVYVFGLPKDYPETFQAKIAALTPAQVKTARATLLGSEDSVDRDRRRLREGEGSARRVQGHHVPRHRRQQVRRRSNRRSENSSSQLNVLVHFHASPTSFSAAAASALFLLFCRTFHLPESDRPFFGFRASSCRILVGLGRAPRPRPAPPRVTRAPDITSLAARCS